MFSLVSIGCIAAATLCVYWISWCTYALYFHPASRFPGPKLAAVSELWYVWTILCGRYPFVIRDAHRRYGPVVRIAPNELSFDTIQSKRDIYSSKNKAGFVKSELIYDTGEPAPPLGYQRDLEKHAMLRKRIAPGFSATALRNQEHIIHKYTDMFVKQLVRLGGEGTKGINVCEAFPWLTFDIMGVLGFGEPFNCVEEARAGPWVSLMTDTSWLPLFALGGLKRRFPAVLLTIPFMLPSGALKMMAQHKELTAAKVRKRIHMDDVKLDWFTHVVEDIKNGKETEEYFKSEASFFALAGAETTSTALSAAIFFLDQNQECLAKLKKEIRTSFTSYTDITGKSTANLPYLNGVIEETLRRYSPAPIGPPRNSPGEMIDGHYVPEGIAVSTQIWVAHHNPKDWVDPESFIPERWMGEPSLQVGKESPANIAFSLGAYQCLGITMAYLEMRIALAKIVYTLDMKVVKGPKDFIEESDAYFLWKKPDLVVQFRPAKE